MEAAPKRNIELKAWLASLEAAAAVAQRLATNHLGVQRQTDTYFHCRHGRLKLREIDGQAAQLIWYQRPDQSGPKASDYRLTAVAEPEALKQTLAAACGVLVVVGKRREIYLYENVRIHLDEVAGLGTFLEFEAVLSDGQDDAAGHCQLAWLSEQFGLGKADLLGGSYSDLLLAQIES